MCRLRITDKLHQRGGFLQTAPTTAKYRCGFLDKLNEPPEAAEECSPRREP
jgi:hypothetical protein